MSDEPSGSTDVLAMALDRYEARLYALEQALGRYLTGTGRAMPQLLGAGSLGGDLTPAYVAINAHFRDQEDLRRLIKATVEARRQIQPMPRGGPLAKRFLELLKAELFLRRGAQICFFSSTWFTAIASVAALERDGAGLEADRAIERIYGAASRVRRNGDRVERRVEGLFRLVESISKSDQAYHGKPQRYFRTALENESARSFRDREMEDADRLGLRPRMRSLDTREERAYRREVNCALQIDDLDPPKAHDDSAVELLISAEDALERERIMAALVADLPPDQARLFDAWRQGEPPSEARKRLGLRKSTESALRNRVARLKKKLGAA